ncbi:unnamed protein product [Hermetia illucens]|uniref:Uncharacterized protein n=1 Tax=Hermetia illucens TaxID=343691 RepID=A0A7R8YNR0_HERIL|nr:uncharacterized protein LOC119660497 [Hermetia illucens]CAD7079926.1 unnamed protein product [Hermetia illucens]
MWRPIAFVCLIIQAVAGTCRLDFNSKAPGVFTGKFGSNIIILSAADGEISWDDNLLINAYCRNGFKGYSSYTSTPEKNLILSCSGSTIYYQTSESGSKNEIRSGYMSCQTESTYYEATISACKEYGLAYGLFVGKQPIILADVCYNLNTMRTQFVHYVAGPRSSVLEVQSTFNPSNTTFASNASVNVVFDSGAIKKENNSLVKAVHDEIPFYAEIVQYQLEELVPLDKSVGILSPYTDDFINTNTIAWWKPLKFGNWELVQEAIDQVSMSSSYDIFAGTSGAVMYPLNNRCSLSDKLTYRVDQYLRDVPLYVWNYVKSRDDKTDKGVIIIGVNSPFFEGGNKTDIPCADICDNIPWLSSLKNVRKMPSLGYVFCCKPGTIKLENFPDL